MSGSERAFQKVKAILGKLDRSIEEARERRLHTVPVAPGQPAQAQLAPKPPAAAAPAAPAPKAPGSPGSIYGRARPIPPSGLGNGTPRWGV